MIIFGHPLIKYLPFYEIISFKDVEKTPSNSTLIFDFDANLANFCEENGVGFAMKIKDKKEAVLANSLNANFIVVEKNMAKEVQNLADEYMFDSKILLLSRSENDFEWAVENFIDGVLFKNSIKRV